MSERRYTLGQRNPNTLPGRYLDSETVSANRTQSAYWRSLRKWVQSANSTGIK